MSPIERPRWRQRDPSLSEADVQHMVRRGWLPHTSIPVLEKMRERHEALISQRETKQAEWYGLVDQFKAEDEKKAHALRDAYRDGREPRLPEMTSDDKRKRLLAEAEQHASAAAEVVVDFALDCLERLRGPVPQHWNAHLAVQGLRVPPQGEAAGILAEIAVGEAQLRRKAEDARRVIQEVHDKLREAQPLKNWFVRTANGGNGLMVPGDDLPVPPAYTPGTKPRDLDVPGWWPDTDPGHGREEPVGADPALDTQPIVVHEDEGGGFYELPDEDAAPLARSIHREEM